MPPLQKNLSRLSDDDDVTCGTKSMTPEELDLFVCSSWDSKG